MPYFSPPDPDPASNRPRATMTSILRGLLETPLSKSPSVPHRSEAIEDADPSTRSHPLPTPRTMRRGQPRSLESIALLLLVAIALVSSPSPVSALSNIPSGLELDKKAAAAAAILEARKLPKATAPPPLDVKLQNNNKDILPAQICGIVGAYLFTLVIIGICLLTFGRRLRREAQYGSTSYEVEMIKSPGRQYDPSPISPASTTKSWMKSKFGRGRKSSLISSSTGPVSPPLDSSHGGFDQKVMESKKEERQRQMELLYQAVMEQDAKKSSTTDVSEIDLPEEPDLPMSPVSPDFPASPLTPRSMHDQLPMTPRTPRSMAEAMHEDLPMSPQSPDFPASPLSPPPQQQHFEAPKQLPPERKPMDKRLLRVQTDRQDYIPRDLASPLSPNSPGDPISPRSPVRAIYPPGMEGPKSPTSPVRSVHGHGHPRAPSVQGLPASPRVGSVHGLPASPRSNRGSMASNPSVASSRTRKALRSLRITSRSEDDEERTPLSPRLPDSGATIRQPPTPQTGKSFNSVTTTHTFITEDDEDEEDEYARRQREAYESLDRVQPLPRPAPHRAPSHPSNLNNDLRNEPSNKSLTSAVSSTSTLPLRNPAYNTDIAVPPTPVKTTYLESKKRGHFNGPQTAGLTPRTGVPMTPYSAYMPFTPITPVTPHLVGKRERKARQKEDRRRVMARDEGDLVKSQEELWGDD